MQLHRVTLGITNTFLIKGREGYVLVDTGGRGKGKQFQNALARLGILPAQIKLIVITHAHFDHVGSLYAIKELCQCPILCHPLEGEIMRTGRVVIPPGTGWAGNAISALGKALKPCLQFQAVAPDILVTEDYNLAAYGIAGRVVATPGHTPGSISVVLQDGRALIGDLAVNITRGSKYPPFAEDGRLLRQSWEIIRQQGATWLYPAHGRSFSIVDLR